MEENSDGFKIAEKDLDLRGPGDIQGTRQSGALSFRIADLVADRAILEKAKTYAEELLGIDPDLNLEENAPVRLFLNAEKGATVWGKIS
jgi:ATP-dependent DNA helicase RecG